MIFDFAEVRCIFEVLRMLNTRKSKYSEMFRKTKVSHTTLQSVLKELNEKEFIVKYDIGHQKVDYEITNKGKKMFKVLLQLTELAK
ncbi:MAG TPA: winged helix-turn-helix transcriptional regulator [Candidatus Nanoarchaeia archaeon]|nr:winged helix-turn-helix transcriptional regulator [Candidatus Nanoarchaeia archaeon]